MPKMWRTPSALSSSMTARPAPISLTSVLPRASAILESRALHARLHVADPLAITRDLDLVALFHPVADGLDPAEAEPEVRQASGVPVDQRASRRGGDARLLLVGWTADRQHLGPRRRARHDALERLGPRRSVQRTAVAPRQVQAAAEEPRDHLGEHERSHQVAEHEEEQGDQDRPPRDAPTVIRELDLEDLGHVALPTAERQGHGLGPGPHAARAPRRGGRADLLDPQVISIGEVREDEREVTGEGDDAVTLLEVHRVEADGAR